MSLNTDYGRWMGNEGQECMQEGGTAKRTTCLLNGGGVNWQVIVPL